MRFFAHKIVVPVLAFMIILASSPVMAAPHDEVSRTRHNLSAGAAGKVAKAGSGVTQICVFCHTPHNALSTGPLWNKSRRNDAASVPFKLYTSSASLTSIARAASLPANSPSLLCLSCHDGKTAMNILHNTSYGMSVTDTGNLVDIIPFYAPGDRVIPVDAGNNVPYMMPVPEYNVVTESYDKDLRTGGPSGDNLTDDHPVGFSYADAYLEKLTNGGGLHDPAVIVAENAVRFFGPQQRVECSSCHNPHLDYDDDSTFSPFLVKSNTGSALCLTCHDK